MKYPENVMVSRERVAGDFDICVRSVMNWERSGILPAPIKLGRTVRHRGSDLNAAIERLSPNSAGDGKGA